MKKLFNVRDFMFNAADVQKLGQYVADQIGLYDGLTLMNWGHLTETQKLKQALTEALEEMTEVRIRDVAHSIGIGHIGSNDVRVMAENLLRSHPDYRFVIMSDHKGQVTRAFENGVLTCCEYEEG